MITQEEIIDNLKHRSQSLKCLNLAAVVLDDHKFSVWSGSSKPNVHHYGKGGLRQHTYEVVAFALDSNHWFSYLNKHVDNKLLFLAALYHDVGKMWDYKPLDAEYKEWTSDDHKYLVHHISRSALIWSEESKKDSSITEQERDDVLHAILAHHGQKAWGSPVEPRTRMAWLLHLSDQMSARMDDCYKLHEKEKK